MRNWPRWWTTHLKAHLGYLPADRLSWRCKINENQWLPRGQKSTFSARFMKWSTLMQVICGYWSEMHQMTDMLSVKRPHLTETPAPCKCKMKLLLTRAEALLNDLQRRATCAARFSFLQCAETDHGGCCNPPLPLPTSLSPGGNTDSSIPALLPLSVITCHSGNVSPPANWSLFLPFSALFLLLQSLGWVFHLLPILLNVFRL